MSIYLAPSVTAYNSKPSVTQHLNSTPFFCLTYKKSDRFVDSISRSLLKNTIQFSPPFTVYQNQILKDFLKGSIIIPTQDKNRPKADFCPSWFIIFGQQKSCAPIKIFITYGVANSKKMVRNPLNTSRTFFAD